VGGDVLLELTTDDLISHIGATALQARKIRNEVGKVTGMRTNSMATQPSQTMSPVSSQPVLPPYNPAPAAAKAPPQPAFTPYSSPAPARPPTYGNLVSQVRRSQSVASPAASELPQNVLLTPQKSGCCDANEMPHAFVTSPLPNVPMEAATAPPLPGQVIVGYEGEKQLRVVCFR